MNSEISIPPADLARLHVSCEGLYPGINFVCFTDRDPASPAYGASFDLPAPIALSAVLAARDAKRAQFAAAASHSQIAIRNSQFPL